MVYGIGALLVGAVAGYWVLERAEKHKGGLQRIGRIIGWVVILISFIGVACRALGCFGPFDGSGKRGWCPFSSSKTAPAPGIAP